tara:strand:- start:378 stop:581 length:204 start_codon:yes stop_codon:yes gene_type:complete
MTADIIEEIKEKYSEISDDYDVKLEKDDGGRVINVNTVLLEYAESLRKVLPSKFKGHKVVVSYYADK